MRTKSTHKQGLDAFALTPPLPYPPGQSEEGICRLYASCELEDASKQEIANYWRQDWRRFVYTYGLTSQLQGSCLELGANPYFTTVLLRLYTPLQLSLANYFGPHFSATSTQGLWIENPATGKRERLSLAFDHFNIEDASFPFAPASFDVVLFCEVIEHLQSDPVKVMREIKRVLKPGGHLIVTTPNVSRLENVARMLAGANIYDPYSGYGPYGRHNREYNRHELTLLLEHCGFEVEVFFSADVHENISANLFSLQSIVPLVKFRENDLGHYLFTRARNSTPAHEKRPAWLYRSYPPDELG
jgi:SAM-dependent methyltransferase